MPGAKGFGGMFMAACVLAIGPGTAAVNGEIQWRAGPVELGAAARPTGVTAAADLSGRSVGSHFIIQFDGPLGAADRQRVEAAGVQLLGYVGDGAFFASLAPGGLTAPALGAAPTVQGVGDIDPAWKLDPRILADQVPEWAVVGLDPLGDDTVAVYVMFHADVALLTDGLAAVEALDGMVRDAVESINALVVEVPLSSLHALAAEDAVQWIEWPLPPMGEVNDSNRAITQADIVQAAPYSLDGSGVTVLVYDGGTARASHVDFQGRLTVHDASGLADHATHVCGTVGGAGVGNPIYKGMALGVTILSYGFEYDGTGIFLYTNPGDIESDYSEAISVRGADVANNSIGTNTATNGFDCNITGDYGVTDVLIDTIVRGDGSNPLFTQPFRVVWANGNERQTTRCGGSYHSTAPPACAKNHITVGALNSNDDSVTSFTSWGPADDGRMKPDVSAPGCQSNGDGGVTSCSSGGDTAYTVKCGTSMASPTTCGLSALLLEDFRVQFPGDPDPRNSTLKVLLAHNAQDIHNVGPDYQTGYGSVRIQQTVDFMRTGSFLENQVDQGETHTVLVSVQPGDPTLKVTLAWDDYPGTPNVDPALVNDLDLKVFDPSSTQYFPWTLDPGNPANAAVQTVADHINNIEQVLVDSPTPGAWRVEIQGLNVPQGPQPFSLCASPRLVKCSSQGVIALGAALYSCTATAQVQVIDCDLNTDDLVIETVTVTIDSTTEPGGETVLLTETAPETADFRGTIDLDVVNSGGVLQVTDGDTVTATYIDADDGLGGINVTVTATAGIDCQGPVISSVQVTDIGAETATITFATDEPAQGTVRYGESCALLTGSAGESGSGTSHQVQLSGLDFSTRYYFAVDAVDDQGNPATDDNGGSCYSFSTPDVVYDFPMDADPGWTTAGQWAFGTPTGGGSSNGDPTGGHTGVNVYGYNLNGDYTDNLAATYLTTPALDCAGLTDVTLSFWRWLGVESNSNFDEATVEVSNNGTAWTVMWRATDLGVDVSDAAWQLQQFDISGVADNQATVYVRWGMGPTDAGVTFPGWNIDDVQIIASGGLLAISFPSGVPELLAPGVSTDLTVRVVEGDESYVPGSGVMYYRYYGGAFSAAPLAPLGGELHRATLPAADCDATPEFYFSAEGTTSGVIHQPPTAPSVTYTAQVGEITVIRDDDFETDQGWSVGDVGDDATTGVWTRNNPEATEAQPENDHTPDPGVNCFVTDYRAGSSLGTYDVDGGKTTLLSPILDLAGLTDVTISYYRWYSNDTGAAPNADVFEVDISSNGGATWTSAETVGPSGSGTSGGWFYHEFNVGDFVTPTDQVRLRFVASDEADPSLVEAAVDDLLVTSFGCESAVAPTITAAASVVTHGAAGDFGAGLAGGVIHEARAAGVTRLVVDFDQAMDPATTVPGNVSVAGQLTGAYAGSIGTSLSGGTELTVTFNPALADEDRHALDLSGMRAAGGGPEVANPAFEVLALKGDANGSLTTNVVDNSEAFLRFGQTAGATNFRYDFNADGRIDVVDNSQRRLYFGNLAP